MIVIPQDIVSSRPAIFDEKTGGFISYSQLSVLCHSWQSHLAASSRLLVFFAIPNSVEAVAALLGCWMAGHCALLVDPMLGIEARKRLKQLYKPNWIIEPDANATLLAYRNPEESLEPIFADTAALLSTSGSTGTSKFVRLSGASLLNNASAVAHILDIRPDDVGGAHLPLHYGFGLSVMLSHLVAGASLVTTSRGLTDREFWPLLRAARVSHLPGVPFHHEVMRKLGHSRLAMPDLRVLTQAGGALSIEARREAHAFMESRGGKFHVMYGQTEAAPRMTTLAHECFRVAPNSVGTPLPGGQINIVNEAGEAVPVGEPGMIHYSGPNVMLGYSQSRADLQEGDVQRGRLKTGDIGFLDDGGRLTITGRSSRYGKVFGLRVSLDEIESRVSRLAPAGVTQKGNELHIFIETSGLDELAQNRFSIDQIAIELTVPRQAIRLHWLPALPRTIRGKVDYAALERYA